MSTSARHTHRRACGDFYVCSAYDRDECPKHWTCPRCEVKALEDYLTAQELDREDTTLIREELTRHEKH
jgi:hypothetical protein